MIWGLMVSPLSQKWLIVTNLDHGLSRNVGFFFISEPILRAGFFNKMLALSPLSLFLAFLTAVFSQFCSKIIRNVAY